MYIIDYLVVIALDEEFRSALNVLSRELKVKLPPRPEGPLVTFRAAVPLVRNGIAQEELLMVVCPGRMGHAAIAAVLPDVLDRYRPRDIILIGLSGSFDPKDLLLGDVLAPMKVFGYAEQKVVKIDGKDSWTFRTLGDRTTSHALAEVRSIANDAALSRKWTDACRRAARRDERIADRLGTDTAHEVPCIHAHHNDSLASGNVVVASSDFAHQLKTQVDTTLRAVEMEAGGLFEALENVDWSGRVLVLRGISDYADEAKSQVENEFKDAWRTYAMQNAVRLAAMLMRQRLEWDLTRRSVSAPYELNLESHQDSHDMCMNMQIGNGLTGAHNLAFFPLLCRDGGTPSFRMSISANGSVSSGGSITMLVRERSDPYTEIRHHMRPNGRIELTKASTENPFMIDLFVSADPGGIGFNVVLTDEFGRSISRQFP